MTAACRYFIKRVNAEGRVAWTGPIRSITQADKEARAWREAGWSAVKALSTPEVWKEVRAWEATVAAHRRHI